MKTTRFAPLASILVFSLLIISCGGSGGSSTQNNQDAALASESASTSTDVSPLKPSESTGIEVSEPSLPTETDTGVIELPECESGAPSSYLVNYYEVSNIHYDNPIDDNTAYQTPISLNGLESVEWSRFGIELNAAHQTYYSSRQPSLSFSLFSQAQACSPLPPTATQHLVNISIVSDNDYSEDYPAGSELASVFAPIKYLATEFPHTALDTFSGKNLPAPRQLSLYLLQEPEHNRQNFTITITLDDGNIFIVETGDIYFSSDAISF